MIQIADRARFASGIITVCLAAQLCSAQGVQPPDLKALTEKYEQGLAAVRASSDKAVQDWLQTYAAELKKVEQKLQTDGDLDGLLAVRKEMERFGREKAIPESAAVAYPVLRELQLKWRKVPETVDIDTSKRIVLLSRSHIAALEDLQKKLTIQGKIEEAIAAKNEADRVRTSAPVTSAEFVLANAGVTFTPEGGKDAKPAGATLPGTGLGEKPSAVATDLRASLLLWYSFDKSEGKRVTDKSGKGNDGEVAGAKWTPRGKVGGAYQVGKKLGHIEVPDQEAWSFGARPFSICLWFSPTAHPSGEQVLIGHDDGGGERRKWIFELLNGNLDFHINNPYSASYRIASCPLTPKFGKWYHLAVTRSGSRYVIYVDGVRAATDQNSLAVPAAGAPLTIGHAEGLYVEGILDEVMIFGSALTADEVKRIHDAQK